MSRHDRPTSRRDFLREGLRSLVNAGFGGVFEKLERVGELMERGEPKPAPLMPLLSCESRALHSLLTAGQLSVEGVYGSYVGCRRWCYARVLGVGDVGVVELGAVVACGW